MLTLILVGLVVSSIGTIIVVIPIATMSRKKIDDVSGSYFDHNKHLRAALIEQRLYAAIGIVFIVVGTGLQTIGSLT